MPTRRQEKFARLIKEIVSEVIRDDLSDPRITGLVSVTRVDVSPDLRNADVFLSVFGGDEASQRLTFTAIEHGRGRIQSALANEMDSKFCPTLHLKTDEVFKKTLETMALIDRAARELKEKEQKESEQD
ncbi:MAG: 30S ribosome-binding factor RbfA [Phycisphaerae bacterium]|jgi:ribosome-binding factor A